jgi:hypothetical protein
MKRVDMLINVAIIVAALSVFSMERMHKAKLDAACNVARELAQSHRDSMEVDRVGCYTQTDSTGYNSF